MTAVPPAPRKEIFSLRDGRPTPIWLTWLEKLRTEFNLGRQDFLIEVQKGNVAGHSLVHKFGRNDAVPNGTWAHVSLIPFDTADFMEAAETVNVVGNNVNDTAGGTGAQTIVVQGIDSTFTELMETITLAGGADSSATSASWWRIHRAWVASSGAYGGNNTGTITIENASTDQLIQIAAGEGQTQYAGWSVPIGKTAYLMSVLITVESGKSVDFRMFTRESFDDVTTSFVPPRLKLHFDGLDAPMFFEPRSPMSAINAKTDIWWECNGSAGSEQVSVDFELLIVDN